MSGPGRPSLRSASLRSVREALPCFPEVPPSGFGYPPGGVSNPDPWEPFSAPDAHGLHPSELSSSPVIGKKVSLPLFRPGSFPPNLPGLAAELWAASPHRRSRAPSCFPGSLPRGGAACSPGRSDLSGSPARRTGGGVSLPDPHPSRSFPRTALRPDGSGTSGVCGSPGPASPPEEGAGPFGLSHRRPCATL